ncbi:MAG: mechanosensitive ion channel family protein [Candidatus Aenigmarchaeota archaeon]|nr:mechanosensitive ion channel family protein [Candidatus Aenigmarchaeota archaeon]
MADISFLSGAAAAIPDYVVTLVVFAVSLAAMHLFKAIALSGMKNMAKITPGRLDDILIDSLNRISMRFFTLLSAYIALGFMETPAPLTSAFFYSILIFGTYYSVKTLQALVSYGTQKMAEERKRDGDGDVSVIELAGGVIGASLWIIAAFFVLQSLGYDITPALAGLGIGGIAIAFALQNVLSDIFASFSIYFDRPFRVGDFIVIGNDMGTVKRIGIKSTRIQTLQGQELIVSNKELTETRVHNFKTMEKRRVEFTFGVTYGTPTKKLEKMPAGIRKIVSSVDGAEFDRAHFRKFGDSALLFEVVYYVKSPDYSRYVDVHEKINLALKNMLEEEGVELAFPTQTLYVKKEE